MDGVQWKSWSPEAVAEARAAGHPVLIDFTADWCMSCKYTKGKALEVKPVIRKLADIDGVAFLADWTDKDPVITQRRCIVTGAERCRWCWCIRRRARRLCCRR